MFFRIADELNLSPTVWLPVDQPIPEIEGMQETFSNDVSHVRTRSTPREVSVRDALDFTFLTLRDETFSFRASSAYVANSAGGAHYSTQAEARFLQMYSRQETIMGSPRLKVLTALVTFARAVLALGLEALRSMAEFHVFLACKAPDRGPAILFSAIYPGTEMALEIQTHDDNAITAWLRGINSQTLAVRLDQYVDWSLGGAIHLAVLLNGSGATEMTLDVGFEDISATSRSATPVVFTPNIVQLHSRIGQSIDGRSSATSIELVNFLIAGKLTRRDLANTTFWQEKRLAETTPVHIGLGAFYESSPGTTVFQPHGDVVPKEPFGPAA